MMEILKEVQIWGRPQSGSIWLKAQLIETEAVLCEGEYFPLLSVLRK